MLRATVSNTGDVAIDWRANGCVNGRTQYLVAGDTWQRVLVPDTEDTVSVLGFDPATSTYTATRYLLDSTAMAASRTARGAEPPACAAGAPQAQVLASQPAAKIGNRSCRGGVVCPCCTRVSLLN